VEYERRRRIDTLREQRARAADELPGLRAELAALSGSRDQGKITKLTAMIAKRERIIEELDESD
jgi:hypothetical protein